MNIEIKKYPFNKDCALCITIDDLHPESVEYDGMDFGVDKNSLFWKQLEKTKKLIPDVCFTLFAVANWIDRPDWPSGIFWPLRKFIRKKREHKKDTFLISQKKYKNWVEFINQMVIKLNLEIGLHGYYHHNSKVGVPTSQEFTTLTKKETQERILNMLNSFKDSKISYTNVFRAPGWGLNDDLIEVLNKNQIYCTALNSDFKNSISHSETNFVANCFPNQTQRAVNIAKQDGVIVVHSHIYKTVWGLKYVDQNFANNINKIVSEIRNQTLKHIWFTTIYKVYEYQQKIKHISVKASGSNMVEVTNNGTSEIKGLTIYINNMPFIVDSLLPNQTKNINVNQIEDQKVSVVLTAYNGQKTVVESLRSICNQSHKNLEIVFLDDGSTDETYEKVIQFIKDSGETRVKAIKQKNGGRSNARNNGYAQTTANLITFCEDDAIYDKEYVSTALNHFKKNPDLGGLIGPHYVWNKYESINTRMKDLERRRNFLNYKPNSTWFYTRELFEKVGRYNEGIEFIEDVEPAIKIKQLGYNFDYEPECRWLHKEPANYKRYLIRKYKGGIGLALMSKTGLKKSIIPTKYKLIVILGVIMAVLVLALSVRLFVLFALLSPLVILIVRYSDLKKTLKVSNENTLFSILSLYFEVSWWMATLFGVFKGSKMTVSEINKFLKGR